MATTAEAMAARRGYTHLAVISGIGTRNYYRKLGFELCPGEGGFMTKPIPWSHPQRVLRSVGLYTVAAAAAAVLAVLVAPLLALALHCIGVEGSVRALLTPRLPHL